MAFQLLMGVGGLIFGIGLSPRYPKWSLGLLAVSSGIFVLASYMALGDKTLGQESRLITLGLTLSLAIVCVVFLGLQLREIVRPVGGPNPYEARAIRQISERCQKITSLLEEQPTSVESEWGDAVIEVQRLKERILSDANRLGPRFIHIHRESSILHEILQEAEDQYGSDAEAIYAHPHLEPPSSSLEYWPRTIIQDSLEALQLACDDALKGGVNTLDKKSMS